jgi:predicted phosphohydrolase
MIEKVLEKLGASVRDDGTGVYALPRVGSGYWMDNSVDDDALLEKECQLYLREKGAWQFCLTRSLKGGVEVYSLDLAWQGETPYTEYIADNTLDCYMKAVLEF